MYEEVHTQKGKKEILKLRRRDEMRTYRNDKLWENFWVQKAHGECICTSK